MIKVHDLQPAPGAHRSRKRVARGTAGKGGKTAGRGTKGQKARRQIPLGFEGGQTRLLRRLPKLRGFTNPFRIEYQAINLDTIAAFVAEGSRDVTPETLLEAGLVSKSALIKVLGRGELTQACHVKAHAFSKSAAAAIQAAGGTLETLPLPFGHGRPPAQGNALTNR